MGSDLVMDRFRVGEQIGAGGMGVVYRAFDERLRREVAVKEVGAGDPERVLREAQAAARLNHPAIVTLYELGRRGDHALLVTELVRGVTLDRLRVAGRLTDRGLAEVGAGLCEALAHAHERGVVHRDVKPQNVIVPAGGGEQGPAKLMDFGIASLTGAPALTASGEVVGTLAYMAPEQAEGTPAGPPADVYSLALTLYEGWAGCNPVAGVTPAATARRIGRPVEPLADHRPDLPPRLSEAIDACLDPEPELRPGPDDLRRALRDAAPELPADSPVPAPAGSDPGRPPGRGRPVARLAAAVALAAGLALLTGPLGLPGAALVIGALGFSALLFLPGAGAGLSLFAPALAAVGALSAYPAAAAQSGPGLARAAIVGALGWWWALALAIGLGLGPRLGIAPRAAPGWESSAPEAASAVLAPLLEPGALLGAAAFALAAAALAWVLSARHLALAALGALLWAAALVSALPALGDGSLADRPLVAAGAAALALAAERWRRSRSLVGGSAPAAEAQRLEAGIAPAQAGVRPVS